MLLTLHRRIGRWLQTGGHIEPGDDTLAAAASREAVEESGLPKLQLAGPPLLLSRHQVTCRPTGSTAHLDVQFLVVTSSRQLPVVSPESHSVEWFSTHALPEVDESVHALIRAASARLGW